MGNKLPDAGHPAQVRPKLHRRLAINQAKAHLLALGGRFRLLDVMRATEIPVDVLLLAADRLAREGRLRFVPGRGMVCSSIAAMPAGADGRS